MHLDLDLHLLPSGQLAGTLRRPGDPAISFRGTFELVTALERLLSAEAPPAARDP